MSPGQAGGVSASNAASNSTYSYKNIDSPPSSDESSSSKSPPLLSPQDPIYVDLNTKHAEDSPDSDYLSPQMALLSPQVTQNLPQPINSKSDSKEILTAITPEPEEEEKLVMKTVPFTFCNMRQNIFDLKRKRGRKLSKPPISNSISSQANSQISDKTNFELPTFEKPCPLRKRKKIPPHEEENSEENFQPLVLKIKKIDSDFYRASSPNPVTDLDYESSDNENLHLQIDDEEDSSVDISDPFNDSKEIVEDVVDNLLSEIIAKSRLNRRSKKSSVPLLDLFSRTPLNSFHCLGCSKSYQADQDTFCVDLKCQTMLLTCGQCRWWTNRRVNLSCQTY